MLEPVLSNPWVRAIGALLALVLLGVAVYILKPILVPLFLAFLVAYVLDPVVDYFEARKVSRGRTIAVLAVAGLVGVLCVPLIVIPSIYHQAESLIQSADSEVAGGAWLDRLLERLPIEKMAAELEPEDRPLAEALTLDDVDETSESEPPVDSGDSEAATVETEPESAEGGTGADTPEPMTADAGELNAREVLARYVGQEVRESAVQFVKGNLSTFATVGKQAGANLFSVFAIIGNSVVQVILFLANFALFAFVAGYLLRDFDGLVRGARELVPPKYRDKTVSVVGQINDQLRSFLRGQITVCLCLGAMYAVGLLIAQTPFAILIAGFGIVASFVPFLGVAMVAIISVTLTVLQHGLDWHVVAVLATIGIAQFLEGNVLTPKIVGDQVGLNPVWVILAIMVFGNFLGFLGLLLAVPMAAALKVLVLEGVAYYRKSPVFAQGQDSG
jgi:predicted PurR-regulated permease PerM